MKILSLNTHSYLEEESEKKLVYLAKSIRDIEPDIVALQEVNQNKDALTVSDLTDVVFAQHGKRLKSDNFGLRCVDLLKDMGYKLIWLGIKQGYEKYDEGVCFLSRLPIEAVDFFRISKCDDYNNWKKRMTLGIKVSGKWFYNVHMGRWDDKEESFSKQWSVLYNELNCLDDVWIMGDFNVPDDLKDEGYEQIIKSGWLDAYELADEKDSGFTVMGKIDGWEDKDSGFINKRIDYFFTNKNQKVKSLYTVFNGKNKDVVSDHYGIIMEI